MDYMVTDNFNVIKDVYYNPKREIINIAKYYVIIMSLFSYQINIENTFHMRHTHHVI